MAAQPYRLRLRLRTMGTYNTIVTKRDTRAYSPQLISEETLQRVLTAGRMAGSSKDSQPVRYVVLRDEKQKKNVAACGNYTRPMIDAPLAIVVLLRREARPFDAGRAAQNVMLAAWEEGITSCPLAVHDQHRARDVLGLPADYEVAMVVALGYPAPDTSPSGGQRRLPLEELVHWDRW